VRNTASRHWTPWLGGCDVSVGKDKRGGGRCLVPASSFAEPDEHTSNPRINRWFQRADGLPLFFAGVWCTWEGDHGTIKAPDVASHRRFAFLTTEASEDVKPYHSKATPLILRTADDVRRWLNGTMMDALELQKPVEKALWPSYRRRRRQLSQIAAVLRK
jgi:putative SOS response-associated peptidase YedK